MLLKERLFLALSVRLDSKKSSILTLKFLDVYVSEDNLIVKQECLDDGSNCPNVIQVIICDILVSIPFKGDRS